VAVTASQRYTNDWDGRLSLAQARVSYQYCEAVYRSGGIPLIAAAYTGDGQVHYEGRGWPWGPPRKVEPLLAKASAVMAKCGGLLLTGGGDVLLREEDCGDDIDDVREMDRDRDFWEAALFRAATDTGKPVFGVCRGLQLINLVMGGTLWTDLPSEYRGEVKIRHQQGTARTLTSHRVDLVKGTELHRICGTDSIEVNSGHHQAVKDLAPGLVVSATSPDGLIEAVEGPNHLMAVQWHPESLAAVCPNAKGLFDLFLVECRAAAGLEPLGTGD
jgi:putative glutamine amidotransferase